jgi:dTDP-L-rhamnose 4-epimerase
MRLSMLNDTVLIVGGAGFIGVNLARALIISGKNVRIIDIFNTQTHVENELPVDLKDKVELIKADVRDKVQMKQALTGVSTVVHFAAETGTGQSMYEIEHYFSVNVQGTAILLDLLQNDACGKYVKSIIVASSRAIYGEGAYQCHIHGTVFPEQRQRKEMSAGLFEPKCPFCTSSIQLLPTPESAPFKPMSVYGLTKQVQEQSILLFAQTRGINGFGLRYQNVYGPGQSLKNPYTGILAVFSNLARQNKNIDIYEDGLESRDFVFINDVIDATVRCIHYEDNYVGALNVGSGIPITVMTVAQEIKNYFQSSSLIHVNGFFRMGDIRHNIADLCKVKEVIGFTPQTSFKDGLYQFLDWANGQDSYDQSAYERSVEELASRGLLGKKIN